MTTTKFNNERIILSFLTKGYGQYSFQITREDGSQLTAHSTNSILVDACRSDDEDNNDWGTTQDAIDTVVQIVLEANNFLINEKFEIVSCVA